MSFAEYRGLTDPVIEINLTPNRPDCTGVNGIARDLGATDIGAFKENAPKPVQGTFPCPVKVTIRRTPALCPGFALRLVRGVKNGPSPDWLQKRLDRHRPAPDQRAGRHHQLHHLRPRPPAARVRRRQGARQSHRAPRQERRDAAGARRPHLYARRGHLRDRRREGRRIARRHHGRRGVGLRREHHRRADRIGAVGRVQHRADRPQARHQFRRALSLRARRRSELHGARPGTGDADGARLLRRRAVGDRGRRRPDAEGERSSISRSANCRGWPASSRRSPRCAACWRSSASSPPARASA